MNWLIILLTIGIFVMQVNDAMSDESAGRMTSNEQVSPGITDRYALDGWGLRGLVGHMWLHGGLFHLLGNMWFLWVFGNAVCAKIGNLRYLGLYLLLGVLAGVAHLLMSDGSAIGASGALNGVVGMYLVLFPENDITCYWSPIIVYWRQFTLSSMWMILFWLFWDIVGATFLRETSQVAYFAHLGGFAAGFGVTIAMCHYGKITMERYERSLVQMWQNRRGSSPKPQPPSPLGRLEREAAGATSPLTAKANVTTTTPSPPRPTPTPVPTTGSITCACGHSIKTSHQYAGKVVRCPRCQSPIVIPADKNVKSPPAAKPQPARTGARNGGQSIRFRCSCGQAIRVPARYAGRSGKCPACKRRLRIPKAI